MMTMRYHGRFRTGLGVLRQYTPKPLVVRSEEAAPVVDGPSIRLVTPSYNQAAFVRATVDSILDQRYPNLTYVVKDGGSTDGSIELLRDLGDTNVEILVGGDSGQADAINLGFERTTEDVMGWLNSDDLLLPGALERVARVFRDRPDVDVVYGHRVLIDRRDREIGRWVLPAHDGEILSWADYIPQETMFWRRSLWDRAGAGLDDTFRFALDWELILRFRAAGATFLRIPDYLGAFRVHSAQKTSAEMQTLGEAEMMRLRQRELGRRVTQAEVNRAVRPYLLRATIEHNREQFRMARDQLRARRRFG